jgi:hypothetical protein
MSKSCLLPTRLLFSANLPPELEQHDQVKTPASNAKTAMKQGFSAAGREKNYNFIGLSK